MPEHAAGNVEGHEQPVGAADRHDGELVAEEGDEEAVDDAEAHGARERGQHDLERMQALGGEKIQVLGRVVHLVEFPQLGNPVHGRCA